MLFTSGSLPTGLSAFTVYYVSATAWTSNSFQISASIGGASINTSGTQSGTQTAVAILNTLSSGSQTSANSVSVVTASDQAGTAALVTVTPTITASSYTAGNVMGGILTFSNALPANFVGMLTSLTLRFKGSIQAGPYSLILFSSSPVNGTYADHAAPTWNASDMAFVLGVYQFDTPRSPLGTHTVFTIDGIIKALVGSSTSLFGLVVQQFTSVNNPASTSDMSLSIGLNWYGL